MLVAPKRWTSTHFLLNKLILRLWTFWGLAIPLTLCIHEWKCFAERKEECYFLFSIEKKNIETWARCKGAWCYAQANGNMIQNVLARHSRKCRVWVLLTNWWPQKIIISLRCVMLPDWENGCPTHFLWDDMRWLLHRIGVVYCDLLSVGHGVGWDEVV